LPLCKMNFKLQEISLLEDIIHNMMGLDGIYIKKKYSSTTNY